MVKNISRKDTSLTIFLRAVQGHPEIIEKLMQSSDYNYYNSVQHFTFNQCMLFSNLCFVFVHIDDHKIIK